MVVQLPTRPGHRGGAVVVTGGGRSSRSVVETEARSGSSFYCAAVLSECDVVDDEPVAAGARLCVVWDLVCAYVPPRGGAWFVTAAARVEAALRPWVQALEDGLDGGGGGGGVPEKLAVRLEHEYAEGGMWVGGLKGRDRVVAELLRAYTGSRPCRRRRDEDDDEDDQDEDDDEESCASGGGGEWHPGARAGPLEVRLCVWERRVTVYRRTGVAVRADVLRGWVGADGAPDAALAPTDPRHEWSLDVDTELVTPLPGRHLQLDDDDDHHDDDNFAAQAEEAEPPQQQEPATPRRTGAAADRTHNDGNDDSDDEGPSDTRRRQRAVIVVFPSARRTLMACRAGNFRVTLAAALHKRLTYPRSAATDLRHLLHYLASTTATTAPWSQRVKADLLHLCQAVGHRRDAATVLGLIAKSAAGTNAGALGDAEVARAVAAVVRRHGWLACAEGVGRVMAAAAHAGARPAAAVAREVQLYVVLATELKDGGCDRAAAIVAAKVVQLALGCSSSLSRGAMADVRDMGHRCLNRVGARDQGLNNSRLQVLI